MTDQERHQLDEAYSKVQAQLRNARTYEETIDAMTAAWNVLYYDQHLHTKKVTQEGSSCQGA